MGADKAHSTPLPTPLPSRKPRGTGSHRQKLAAPDTAACRPTEVGCSWGRGGAISGQTKKGGGVLRVIRSSWCPLGVIRGASQRPPPHLPHCLYLSRLRTYYGPMGWDTVEREQDRSAQMDLHVGRREDDRTRAIIKCRLCWKRDTDQTSGFGDVSGTLLWKTTKSGQVKGERQQNAAGRQWEKHVQKLAGEKKWKGWTLSPQPLIPSQTSDTACWAWDDYDGWSP